MNQLIFLSSPSHCRVVILFSFIYLIHYKPTLQSTDLATNNPQTLHGTWSICSMIFSFVYACFFSWTSYFFSWTHACFLGRVRVFLFSYFLVFFYKFPALKLTVGSGNCIFRYEDGKNKRDRFGFLTFEASIFAIITFWLKSVERPKMMIEKKNPPKTP